VNMFNLEQAISEWRRRVLAAGITPPPGAVDELEGPLREELERQGNSGLTEEEAFKVAVQRTGRAC
jgi:hypothetical protein